MSRRLTRRPAAASTRIGWFPSALRWWGEARLASSTSGCCPVSGRQVRATSTLEKRNPSSHAVRRGSPRASIANAGRSRCVSLWLSIKSRTCGSAARAWKGLPAGRVCSPPACDGNAGRTAHRNAVCLNLPVERREFRPAFRQPGEACRVSEIARIWRGERRSGDRTTLRGTAPATRPFLVSTGRFAVHLRKR